MKFRGRGNRGSSGKIRGRRSDNGRRGDMRYRSRDNDRCRDSSCGNQVEEHHLNSLSSRRDSPYGSRDEDSRGEYHLKSLSRCRDSCYSTGEEENPLKSLSRRQDSSYSTREEENHGEHHLMSSSRFQDNAYSIGVDNRREHHLKSLSNRRGSSYGTREEENHVEHLKSLSGRQDSPYSTQDQENHGDYYLKSLNRCEDSSYSTQDEENHRELHLKSLNRREDSSYSTLDEENRGEHHLMSLGRHQDSSFSTRDEHNHGEHHLKSLSRRQDSPYSTRAEENRGNYHLKRLSPPQDRSERVALSNHGRSSTERRDLSWHPDNPIIDSRELAFGQSKDHPHYDEKTDLSRHSNNPIMDFRELAFGKSKDQSRYDEGFPQKDCPSVDHINECSVQEPADSNIDVRNKYICGYQQAMTILKEEEEFFRTGYSALDGYCKPVQEPSHLDDGAAQSLFEVPSMPLLDSGELTGDFLSSSSANLNASLYYNDEEFRCSEPQHPTNIHPREYHQNEEPMLYPPNSVSYPTIGMSLPKEYQSTPSTLQKEDSLGIANNHLPMLSDDLGNCKFIDTFSRDGYNAAPIVESARDPKDEIYQRSSLGYSREEQGIYGCHETERRENIDLTYPCGLLYRTTQPTTRGDDESRVLSRKRAMDLDIDTSSHQKYTHRRLGEDHVWGHQSLNEEAAPCYLSKSRNLVATHDAGYSSTGSKYLEFGERVSGGHGYSHREGDNGLGADAGPKAYKERLNNPHRLEVDPNMRRLDVNHERGLNVEDADKAAGPVVYKERLDGPARPECNRDMYRLEVSHQWVSKAEEAYKYDPSDEVQKRKLSINPDMFGLEVSHQWDLKAAEAYKYDPSDEAQKRKVSMDEYKSTHDPRCTSSKSGHIYGELYDLNDGKGQFTGQPLEILPPPKVSAFSRLKQKEIENPHDGGGPARVPASERLSGNGEGFANESCILNGQKPSTVIQFRSVPANKKGSKLSQRESTDEHSRVVENTDSSTIGKVSTSEVNPQDGSVEFENLVDKAFLRFSKHLNETSAQRRRYKEQGKAGKLLCSVCGSLSKDFLNTRSLVAHAFASKVGSKADHLGLHKALCVLMGWNSEPINTYTWNYRPLPAAEALSLKENLILWPPSVIIHNSSIGNKNSDLQKVVTVEGMEAILKDIGLSAGTSKVCRGKPANQSIMVVKFMPTFSGLQAAERLHKYYADKKHGRDEYDNLQLQSNSTSVSVEDNKPENVLYGYLGLSEDMDKLEFETKKWCSIKSKKDIHAIADAPLKG